MEKPPILRPCPVVFSHLFSSKFPPRVCFPASILPRAAPQAQHTAASGSCPKAKDFDDVTQEIISLAITEYRVLLSGKYAFPDPTIELDYLRRAWTKAFKELEVAIESTPTISKLGSWLHLCGELKTKVKPLAEFMYEFASGQNKKAIAANRQRSEELKENLTFTFKDIKGRKGIYRHPLFQKGVNAMWFANPRDEGPRYPAVFNLFPKEALALVLTARGPTDVELARDIWMGYFLDRVENKVIAVEGYKQLY
ncbi:hypothetical protein B0H14DRAFT_3137444 [Mycena olivaceomarginata]|nr:hypothetical protein B0H14DRAFT_3154936 [Mycena olivaceomarginata]KAJ7851119.1 hypothetical protein B0H14DRAFT_3137444 [Mycena olivaceomarginata]